MSPDSEVGLDAYRRFFAEEVLAVAGVDDTPLLDALAEVRREDFLGPGPWQILGSGAPKASAPPPKYRAYRESQDADPRRLYHNVLVAIDPSRGLNNGQPSALAAWIHTLRLQPGERVLHIGCGVGYYTAIMGCLVGPAGHVMGIEVDAQLAARARANLAGFSHVEADQGDGASYDPGPVDAIFVNAGVTHPQRLWLERLRPGGRLLLPLTTGRDGFMLLVFRAEGGFSARPAGAVSIYAGDGMRRDSSNTLLWASRSKMGALGSVRSLRLDEHTRSEGCWLHDVDWCLSAAELPEHAGEVAAD